MIASTAQAVGVTAQAVGCRSADSMSPVRGVSVSCPVILRRCFQAVLVKQRQKLVLKRDFPVVFLLRGDVGPGIFLPGGTHREYAVSGLPGKALPPWETARAPTGKSWF